MIVLEIPVAPPGLNVLLRMNWYRRHAEGKKWKKLVWVARCQALIGKPAPISKAKVTLIRTSPKLLDEDNLYGSAKLVLDALRYNELIVNDDQDHLQLERPQQRIGKPNLRIEIEDLSTSHSCTSELHFATTSSVDAR